MQLISGGARRICVCSPTGGGKTRIAEELIAHYLAKDWRVILYSNRKMLVEQLSQNLHRAGLRHGVRAAGYEHNLRRDLQVSSIQTEASRVLKRKTWAMHDAELVLIDEAHLQRGESAQALMRAHEEAGAVILGLTATPLDLGGLYDVLVQAGTNSELRACGALVPAIHYGPDEPDLKHVGKVRLGEDLTEKQAVKAMMVPGIFGRVLHWFRKLNPESKPSILFAPGVKESLWLAEQFWAEGITAAHISGEDVWVNGQFYESSKEAKADVLERSRHGEIVVLCNRFVLREGIDCPWLQHGILATVFGSLQSYLQSGGRLLRSHPSVRSVTVQDHGGNWWRHGSLNADRTWDLGLTAARVAAEWEDGFVNPPPGDKPPPQPVPCPQCMRILAGSRCPCGWQYTGGARSRPVVQADGSLRFHGEPYKPRRISTKPNAAKIWERVYHRAKRSGMTFRQAEALYAMENSWAYPDRGLPLMPLDPGDMFARVADVPADRLVPKENTHA